MGLRRYLPVIRAADQSAWHLVASLQLASTSHRTARSTADVQTPPQPKQPIEAPQLGVVAAGAREHDNGPGAGAVVRRPRQRDHRVSTRAEAVPQRKNQ